MNSKVYYIAVYKTGDAESVVPTKKGNSPMLYSTGSKAVAAAQSRGYGRKGLRAVPVTINEVNF